MPIFQEDCIAMTVILLLITYGRHLETVYYYHMSSLIVAIYDVTISDVSFALFRKTST